MFQGNMFCLNIVCYCIVHISDVGFKHVSNMIVQFMLFHGALINSLCFNCRLEMEITVMTFKLSLIFCFC